MCWNFVVMLRYFANIQDMLFLTTSGGKSMRKGIANDNPVTNVRQVESCASITFAEIRPNHFEEVRILTARYGTPIAYEVAIGNH